MIWGELYKYSHFKQSSPISETMQQENDAKRAVKQLLMVRQWNVLDLPFLSHLAQSKLSRVSLSEGQTEGKNRNKRERQ